MNRARGSDWGLPSVPLRVVDDRGRMASLAWACVLALSVQLLYRAIRLARQSRLRFVARVFRLVVSAFFVGGGLIAVALLSIAAAAVLLSIYEGAAGLWLVMFSPVAVSLLFSSMALARNAVLAAEAVGRKAASAMLGRSRCPRCGYELTGLVAAPDGCVVCSECASAWRAVRIGAKDDPGPEVEVMR